MRPKSGNLAARSKLSCQIRVSITGQTLGGACVSVHESTGKILHHRQPRSKHSHPNITLLLLPSITLPVGFGILTLPSPTFPPQVPQLVKMIGPDPAKFAGLSPRVDEELGRSDLTVLAIVLVFILNSTLVSFQRKLCKKVADTESSTYTRSTP